MAVYGGNCFGANNQGGQGAFPEIVAAVRAKAPPCIPIIPQLPCCSLLPYHCWWLSVLQRSSCCATRKKHLWVRAQVLGFVRQLKSFKLATAPGWWLRGAGLIAADRLPWPKQARQVRERWLETRWTPLPPQMVQVDMNCSDWDAYQYGWNPCGWSRILP